MNFTLTMMICQLVLGPVSSLCAGFVCATISRNRIAPKVAAAIMVILFLPVHYMLWAKFPIWYHLFFLITLAPTVLIGAGLVRRSPQIVYFCVHALPDLRVAAGRLRDGVSWSEVR